MAAGALLVRDGKVLLVKRANPPNKGLWAVPGGLVELGETLREAAAREAMEELGVRITVNELFEVTNGIHPDARGKVRYHFIMVDFMVRHWKGRFHLDPESSAMGWFDSDEVRRLRMPALAKRVVLRLLETEVSDRTRAGTPPRM